MTRIVTGRDASGMDIAQPASQPASQPAKPASQPAARVAGGILRLAAWSAAWSTVAVLLASPGAWAQTSTKLTGNVDQSFSSSQSLDLYDLAQAFTMSGNSGGYKLTEVGIEIVMSQPTAPSDPTYSVSIHSNSGGEPGSNLGTLTNPSERVESTTKRTGSRPPAKASTWVPARRISWS